MKPLSPMKFFISNKKKSLVIFIIMILSVAVVSFITSLVTSIIIDATNANLKPFEYCSAVTRTSNELFLNDDVIERIKNFPETEKVINIMNMNTSFNALMGNTSSPVYFTENKDDMNVLLNVNHLSVAGGRLPESGQFEVALHENILKNKNLEIGDYIGSDVQEDEWLEGKYKIVGILKGEPLISLGSKDIYTEMYRNSGLDVSKPMVIAVIPKDGKLSELNKQLDMIEKKDAIVYTYSSIQNMFESQIESMNAILQVIIFVVTFILSISAGALFYIIYMGRSDEFGILYAMGYRKEFIKKLILKELFSLSSVGWIFGYFLSLGAISLINTVLLSTKGQTLYFFTNQGLINTLFIPVLLIICAALPIAVKLKNWDPIAVIERRD